MNDDKIKIEHRMQNMKNFYLKIGEMINNLPDTIPNKIKSMLQEKILGDKELKDLMDGVDAHRPPRIFLIGRTGVGKSSLINAICGTYVAKVSDINSCTDNAYSHEIKDRDGRVLMEIFDTRGIAESDSLDDTITAEDLLIDQINEFSPDIALFLLNCTHRDDVTSDVEFLKKVSKKYTNINKSKLPIVVVVNKCDEMAPTIYKVPSEYPPNKVAKIEQMVKKYKGIIMEHGLKIENIIAVSSLIEWQTQDGESVDVDDIDNLLPEDIDNLQIAFDGRYKIDELFDILEKAIPDVEAQMGLKMAFRLKDVVKRFARHLNHIFAGISATVALTPIPVSDIYILLIIQAVLVALIASLSGRDISLDTAREFILSMGGITGAGFAFRLIAQQTSKLINVVCPGSGSVVSSAIAAVGTSAIGNAAIAYYIDGKTLKETKKLFKKEKNKKQES